MRQHFQGDHSENKINDTIILSSSTPE